MVHLQEDVSAAPYSAQFVAYGRLTSRQKGEMRVFLVTNENVLKKLLEQYEGVKEVARSGYYPVYSGQTIHVNMSGNLVAVSKQTLKIVFDPFKLNRLEFPIEVVAPSDSTHQSCRLTLIGSLRQDLTNNISPLCSLDVRLDENVSTRPFYPWFTSNVGTCSVMGEPVRVHFD